MSILPELDESILDKLMLFKIGEWKPDFSMPEGVEARIEKWANVVKVSGAKPE